MPEHCKKQSPFARVSTGLYRGGAAEKVPIDYSFLPEPLDYQIVHLSRGCPTHMYILWNMADRAELHCMQVGAPICPEAKADLLRQ